MFSSKAANKNNNRTHKQALQVLNEDNTRFFNKKKVYKRLKLPKSYENLK